MNFRRAADRKTRPTERLLIVITIFLAILALGGDSRRSRSLPRSKSATQVADK